MKKSRRWATLAYNCLVTLLLKALTTQEGGNIYTKMAAPELKRGDEKFKTMVNSCM